MTSFVTARFTSLTSRAAFVLVVATATVAAALPPPFQVKELIAGATGSNPHYFAGSDSTDIVFFVATEGGASRLWRTDGTTAGTIRLSNTADCILRESMAVRFGKLFFGASGDGVGCGYGWELWTSDGTTAGTALLKDINAVPTGVGSNTFGSNPLNMTVANYNVYFRADDGITGPELWTSDGTVAGTDLVADIRPGPSGSLPAGMTRTYWYFGNDYLEFSANDGTNGTEFWHLEGAPFLAADIASGPASSDPGGFVEIIGSGRVLFWASDATYGSELWRTISSNSSAPTLVKDIRPGPASSNIHNLCRRDYDLAFFSADDGSTGRELWRSDFTPAGTVRITDLAAGSADSIQDTLWVDGCGSAMADVNGSLFFAATDGVNGRELWKSDGVPGDAQLVKDINPGAAGSSPQGFLVANGRLYFIADDGSTGRELWTSDGTDAGTVRLSDIAAGPSSSLGSAAFAPRLSRVGGTLLFAAADDAGGSNDELWAILLCGDGTTDPNEECDSGAANGTDGCCSTTCTMIDTDGDGTCDAADNCTAPNGDQRDSDGDCTSTDPSACGDVCDPCPLDATNSCDFAGAFSIDSDGGSLGVGDVTIDVPAGSVDQPTSFSVTVMPGSEYGLGTQTGGGPTFNIVKLGPEGVPPFDPPVTVTFFWDDVVAPIGVVDGTGFDESKLRVYKNGAAATKTCSDTGCKPANCGGTNCGVGALVGVAGVCCDPVANKWTLPLTSFSEFVVAGDPCEEPSTTCHAAAAGGSLLQIVDNADDAKDKLVWKWKGSVPGAVGDFGNPLSVEGDGYALCFYDATAPAPVPVVGRVVVPPGGTCGTTDCWTTAGTTGFKYKRASGQPEGAVGLVLKAGAHPKATLKGKGTFLGSRYQSVPTPPLDSPPLPILLQLRANNGECWQATYSTPATNRQGQFKAKSD